MTLLLIIDVYLHMGGTVVPLLPHTKKVLGLIAGSTKGDFFCVEFAWSLCGCMNFLWTLWLLGPKLDHWELCLCWHIVLNAAGTIFPQLWSLFSGPLPKRFEKPFGTVLVHCYTTGNPILHKYTLNIKENYQHGLNSILLCIDLFIQWPLFFFS